MESGNKTSKNMLSPDVPEFKPRHMEEPVSTYEEQETSYPHWEQNFQATSPLYNSYLLSGGGYGGDFAAHYIPQSFSPLHLPPPASHGPYPIGPYSEGATVNQNYQNTLYEVSDTCASWSPSHQNVSGFHQKGMYSPQKQKKYGHHPPGEGNLFTRNGQQKSSNNHKKYAGKKLSKFHESDDRNVESYSRSEVKKSAKWSVKEHSDQQLTKKASKSLVVSEEYWPSLNQKEKTSSEKHFSKDRTTVVESGNCTDSDKVWSKTFSEAFKGSTPKKKASPDGNELVHKEEEHNEIINSLKKKKVQKSLKPGSKSNGDNEKSGKSTLKKDRFSEGEFKRKEKHLKQDEFKKRKQPNQNNHKHSSNSIRLGDGQQNVSGRSSVTVYDDKSAEFGKEGSCDTNSKLSLEIVKEENGNREEFQVKETMAERIAKSFESKDQFENAYKKTIGTTESGNTTIESGEVCVKHSHTLNSNPVCKGVYEWQVVKSEKKKKNTVPKDAEKQEQEKSNSAHIHGRRKESRLKTEKRGQGGRMHTREDDENSKEKSKNTLVKKSSQSLGKSTKRWNQADEANKENTSHLKRYSGTGVEVKHRSELEISQKVDTTAKIITEPQVFSNDTNKLRETGAKPKTRSFIEQQKRVRKPRLSPFRDTESKGEEMPNLSEKTVDKYLENRAAKRNEKRMEERRKRESKIKLAKELSNRDVRITIVTKEMVESMNPDKESVKNVQKYNITIEDYPALDQPPSMNTSKSKKSPPLSSISKGSKRMPKLQNLDVTDDPEWENIDEPTPLRNEVPVEPASLSYSLALKAVGKKAKPPPAAPISTVKKTGKEKKEPKPPPNQPKKKVKTKGLIQFDILSMLEQQTTKKQQKMKKRMLQAKTSQQKSAPTVTVGGVVRTAKGMEPEHKRRKPTSLRRRLQKEKRAKSEDLLMVLKEYAKNSSILQEVTNEVTNEPSSEGCSEEKSKTAEEMSKEIMSTSDGVQALEESMSSVMRLPENIEKLRAALLKDLKSRENTFHNKKFREYCNQLVTPEINQAVTIMIEMLVKFQERHYQRDPVKARIRRRYVSGLKETTKLMNKMSCIILVPDIQRSAIEGSLDDQVKKLINKATECEVPVVFALTRRFLGYLLHKRTGVSCMGIMNFQGAQDAFNHIMELVPVAQEQYHKMISLPGRQPEEDDDDEKEGEYHERTEDGKRDGEKITDEEPEERREL
ncbi:SECIS-binding protein 2 [Oratosquilla oratoria]|uniref:SECIS-binding protein 2 n=1 Tax=Oratosquilla oratoria TaxID=337810 RepID=UPI003F75FE30